VWLTVSRVATGYGQPSSSHYDWTLVQSNNKEDSFRLPDEMDARLRIEMFSDKVTDTLYNNIDDPVGLASDKDKSALVGGLVKTLEDLEESLKLNLSRMPYLFVAKFPSEASPIPSVSGKRNTDIPRRLSSDKYSLPSCCHPSSSSLGIL
jgi:hypothetical protein